MCVCVCVCVCVCGHECVRMRAYSRACMCVIVNFRASSVL